MSQAAVEKAIGKLVTDDAFRARFFGDPAGASFQAGLELSAAEVAALSRLPKTALAAVSRRLDDRLRRLCLDADPGDAAADAGDRETDAAGNVRSLSGATPRGAEAEGGVRHDSSGDPRGGGQPQQCVRESARNRAHQEQNRPWKGGRR
jgi:hypothetical protein